MERQRLTINNTREISMNPNSSKPVLVCAFGLLAAFFMPWFQFFGSGISGYNLGQLGSYGNYVWVIPILAGATILLSFSGINNRGIGIIAGMVPLGAILYGLLRIGGEGGGRAIGNVLELAGQVLSIGAWLTIIFSISIIIAAVINKIGGSNFALPMPDFSTLKPKEPLNLGSFFKGLGSSFYSSTFFMLPIKLQDTRSGQILPLNGLNVSGYYRATIGRKVLTGNEATAHIKIPADFSTISGMHAEFFYKDGITSLKNKSQTNPTEHNGNQLETDQTVILSIGDQIKMGPIEFKVI